MLATLRQPRYLGLLALAMIVALLCVLAGSWQIARFTEKRAANDAYRANDRAAVADVSAVLGPAVAAASGTGRQTEFREASASGSYLTGRQTLVRDQTVNNTVGYLILTPLQTPGGVLLVVRGFVPADRSAATTPTDVPAPPSGQVTVLTRLQTSGTAPDRFGQLPAGQVQVINAEAQSRRLGQPVWASYGQLLPGQPGAEGLQALPAPDMDNPAGGAVEPQHAAYIVQWYLFALLALAAPLVLARAERRRDTEAGPDQRQARPSLDDRLAGHA